MHNQFYNIKPKHCLKIQSREDIEEYRGILILQGGAVLDHTTIDCRGVVLWGGAGAGLCVHQTFVFSVWHVSRIALDIADVLGR